MLKFGNVLHLRNGFRVSTEKGKEVRGKRKGIVEVGAVAVVYRCLGYSILDPAGGLHGKQKLKCCQGGQCSSLSRSILRRVLSHEFS